MKCEFNFTTHILRMFPRSNISGGIIHNGVYVPRLDMVQKPISFQVGRETSVTICRYVQIENVDHQSPYNLDCMFGSNKHHMNTGFTRFSLLSEMCWNSINAHLT